MTKKNQVCSVGVWDSSIPGISFDEKGVSSYAKLQEKLCSVYPQEEIGKKNWESIVKKIKKDGKGKRYDCIIGLSGGTDSSYLIYLAKEVYGLRPLAVNLDNGWSSDIAVENIKKVTTALNIDLETYVIDYHEVMAVLRAYIKASLPWIDGPTDLAIKAVLYKIASRERIKYILNGSDFRTEGKQPTEWTYCDAKQLLSLVKKFEGIKLNSYPYDSIYRFAFNAIIQKIKVYRPYYYLNYSKNEAQEFLIKNYDWKYYGGHHHENIFTKFSISYWMPKKFNADKRKISLSAQIINKDISKEAALEILEQPPYDDLKMKQEINYLIKKLNITHEEFNMYLEQENKYYYDYPSYMNIYKFFNKHIFKIFSYFLPFTPTIVYEQENRKSN